MKATEAKIKKSDIFKFFKLSTKAVLYFFTVIGKRRSHLLAAKFVRAANAEEAAKHFPKFKSIHLQGIFELDSKEYIVALNVGRRKSVLHYRRFYEKGVTRPIYTISQPYKTAAPLKTKHRNKKLKNDYQVRTLATVLGITYNQAYKYISAHGWSERHVGNVESKHFESSFKNFGKSKKVVFEAIDNEVQRITVNTAALTYTKGTYFADTSSHVVAIVDGVIFDSHDSRNCLVTKLFKVTNRAGRRAASKK